MKEACYCGRIGGVEDREPVVDHAGERALRCPNEACGHLEYLPWLPKDARDPIFEAAEARRFARMPAA